MSDEDHSSKGHDLRFLSAKLYSEEIMDTASTLIEEEKQSTTIEPSVTEQLPLTEAPEISRSAWKVIILLLAGGVVFLASVGTYVLSSLHRFQNCL